MVTFLHHLPGWLLSPFLETSSLTPLEAAGIVALFAGVVALGGAVRGLIGFGFPIVTLSLFSLYFPPIAIVPLIVAIQAGVGLVDFPRLRHRVDWSLIRPLLVGCLFGIPLGVAVLSLFDQNLMRVLVGLGLLTSVSILALGFKLGRKPTRAEQIGTGVLSGFLQGAVAMSGPPAVIILLAMEADPKTSKATLALFYGFIGGIALAMGAAVGLATWPHLAFATLLAPCLLGGQSVGFWISNITGGRGYRGLSLALLTLVGIAALIKGLFALL